LGAGLGDGLGDGFGDASGDGLGEGLALGDPLGVGFGLGVGLGLGLGGTGLGSCFGTVSVGVTVTGGVSAGAVVRVVERRLFFRVGVVGFVMSAGAGPASAGLDTSAPVAAGACVERRVRLLAIFEPVVNEHGWPPATDDSVNLFPLLRPLSETMAGAAIGDDVAAAAVEGDVDISPNCNATAV